GYGTLDELFETLTWAQIGLHTKPVGLLNTCDYFSPLLAMIERARSEKFIYDEHRDLLVSSTQPLELLEQLEKFQMPSGLDRWVNR
ncbi:TIGR00730 family Rossman fold protein, partial [bacterium]|nr:TIGR00730 family Rossman fold protein [bacterium]